MTLKTIEKVEELTLNNIQMMKQLVVLEKKKNELELVANKQRLK